jgi:aldose 1-epimerase
VIGARFRMNEPTNEVRLPDGGIRIFLTALAFVAACGGDRDPGRSAESRRQGESAMGGPPTISSEPWGITASGDSVTLFTIRNSNGMSVQLSDWGGIVTRVEVPDRGGRLADVVLGYDSLSDYLEDSAYTGAIVGRFANRIDRGRFELEGRPIELPLNDDTNHLHGGVQGFDRQLWKTFTTVSGPIPGGPFDIPGAGRASVVLSRVSEDGEEGYPGRLETTVTISLTNGNELKFEYEARTDAPTVFNLTHHDYWNLAGHETGSVLGHELQLHASRFTPVGQALIPTGELRHVESTPFDFRTPATLGARIDADDDQLRTAGGYDHNFVLDDWTGDGSVMLAGRLRDPQSGRVMEVLTSEPGIQVYSGNFFSGAIPGKDGAVYRPRAGVCLETQHFPDSPNREAFPTVVLRPGETYRSTTVYRFRTD